jgi:hypothetical protein
MSITAESAVLDTWEDALSVKNANLHSSWCDTFTSEPYQFSFPQYAALRSENCLGRTPLRFFILLILRA